MNLHPAAFIIRLGFLTLLSTWATLVHADDAVLSLRMGEVMLARSGTSNYQAVRMGTRLDPGDRLRTGTNGWARITLSDGSQLVLTARSEVMVRTLDSQERSGEFEVLSGMLRARVPKQDNKLASYRFRTLTATAGIRGTDFIVLNKDPANVYFGNTGHVSVSGASGADQSLTSETLVETTRGLPPIQPISIKTDGALQQVREVINQVTENPPESWLATEQLPDQLARWNINYSHYLADAGRDAEALHTLQLAIDLASAVDTRSDALLARATVHARNPENIELALQDYAPLIDLPLSAPQRETAIFMSAKALYQLNRNQEARLMLYRYLREYENGRYGRSSNTLLNLMR